MSSSHKLSLFSAIVININIMLGAGMFINTAILAKQAGALGSVTYLVVGILLLPLILTIAQLMRYHQEESTFYHFGSYISPFFGFISSWSYFIAKLASCALGIHVCISFLQQIIPLMQIIPTLVFDLAVVLLFTILNLFNLKTGQAIQSYFIILKLVPILFVVFASIYLFTPNYLASTNFIMSGVPLSIPLVLYAFSGFEASCSLSRCIKNPEKNGPIAIVVSYIIVISIAFLYQFCFYSNIGPALGQLANGYLGAFPALLSKLFNSSSIMKESLEKIIHIGIASSSLGASYGIMYSNGWNLYTLAVNNHIWYKKIFTTLNKHNIPVACTLAEGIIAASYLLITKGIQIPLQQVAAIGAIIAYSCSAFALILRTRDSAFKEKIVPYLSVISCFLLFSSFVWGIWIRGLSALLLLFFSMLLFGTYMFFKKHKPDNELEIFEQI